MSSKTCVWDFTRKKQHLQILEFVSPLSIVTIITQFGYHVLPKCFFSMFSGTRFQTYLTKIRQIQIYFRRYNLRLKNNFAFKSAWIFSGFFFFQRCLRNAYISPENVSEFLQNLSVKCTYFSWKYLILVIYILVCLRNRYLCHRILGNKVCVFWWGGGNFKQKFRHIFRLKN